MGVLVKFYLSLFVRIERQEAKYNGISIGIMPSADNLRHIGAEFCHQIELATDPHRQTRTIFFPTQDN